MMGAKASRRTLRAADVLPADLLALLQTYAAGRSLWIPAIHCDAAERRRTHVIRLRETGRTGKQIANIVGISVRRVWQILAAERLTGGDGG